MTDEKIKEIVTHWLFNEKTVSAYELSRKHNIDVKDIWRIYETIKQGD